MGLPGALGRLAGILSGAIMLGWLIGHVWLALCVALALLLGWHLVNLHHLERWLRRGPPLSPPESFGLWATVFERLYRFKRAEWHRKRRMAVLLRQFRQATAALPDGVVVLNRADQVLWFNDAATRLLGLSPRTDIGNPLGNVVRHPAFATWLRRGDTEPLPIPSPRDESIRLTLRQVPYTTEEKLLVARNVTHLHRLEQVRKDFVANASHELRTPLTVVSGYLEALEEDPPPEWISAVAEMRNQTRRMRSIVEDLLTLSRLDAASRPADQTPVQITDLVDTIVRDAETLSGGRHRFNVDVDRALCLRGDASDLRSAFSNLVVNAVRYTQEGGEISVRWFADNGRACFQVADNGPGIPAKHIPRLTERFYRVSPSRSRHSGGTGLGLSIVKHVLNLHQGKLVIDSKPGTGSTFTCLFPRERVVHQAA